MTPASTESTPPLIISVSGLRGIVGQSLTPDVACRYVASFAASLPPGAILIGRDGRTTGSMLRNAIVAGVMAAGRDVLDADVIATPTIGVLVRELSAAGAVQISASHNPAPYNGIKLFGGDGRVLDAASGSKIRDHFHSGQPAWCEFDCVGQVSMLDDPHQPHLTKVLATVDVGAIAAKRFRVLLDSNHGCGGVLGMRLLTELGCDVHLIGGEPTGQFLHPPEPTDASLAGVAAEMCGAWAAVGFCQDPDADRLALIDETGRSLGEEATLSLCIRRAMLVGRTRGPIVINQATSSMSEQIASAHGVKTIRSAVGEANVVGEMIAASAVYGGEGNGGPIDPTVGYVRDSFVGMAQVLDLMSRTGKPLSRLAAELPRFAIFKDKVDASAEQLSAALPRLRDLFSEAKASTGDGLRLTWSDRWLLIRGSNTEPIVRLIAEAPTESEAVALCTEAKRVM